jgi:multidrug efflux pump subunit AcrA (membrane-fusion protein)
VTALEAMLGEALGGSSGGGNRMVSWEPEAGEGIEEAEEAEAKEEQPEPEPGGEKPRREPDEEELEPRPRGAPNPGAGSEPKPEAEPESEPASVPVLRTSSTRLVVSVELEANQQSIAHRGQNVQVVLPGGAEVPARVRGLAAVDASAGEGPGEEAEPGIEATISVTGKHHIPALEGATVSIRFTQRVRKHVLSVPLTALIAIGGERFAVDVHGKGARQRVVVSPGLAADGYVEVEGKGLRAGMTVEAGE